MKKKDDKVVWVSYICTDKARLTHILRIINAPWLKSLVDGRNNS